MNVKCDVCGASFDHGVGGIDWHDEKFICWPCNDQGYDLTRLGQITRHGKLADVLFGDKTLANAKPSTLAKEFAVSPGWAGFKFGCAWATIATVVVGVALWSLVAAGLAGVR